MAGLKRRQILSNTAAALAAAVATRTGPALADTDAVREYSVEIRAFKFVPEVISAKPGDTITWINSDIVPHTATARDKSWDTGTIPKGGSKSLKVTADMQADYFCRFHPMMKASLDLREDG